MEPRLIRGLHAEYVRAEWTGRDTSGLRLYGDDILVKIDVCSPATKGGVELPLDMQDKMTQASESGLICAVGPLAYEQLRKHGGETPQVGERIVFQKFAGNLVMGADGVTYRVMGSLNTIAGFIEAPAEEAA
jgi:co-chaperonin GroES (HSP10)